MYVHYSGVMPQDGGPESGFPDALVPSFGLHLAFFAQHLPFSCSSLFVICSNPSKRAEHDWPNGLPGGTVSNAE
jgi:hypothetical protein